MLGENLLPRIFTYAYTKNILLLNTAVQFDKIPYLGVQADSCAHYKIVVQSTTKITFDPSVWPWPLMVQLEHSFICAETVLHARLSPILYGLIRLWFQ